jgi:prephenate dehydrogenase
VDKVVHNLPAAVREAQLVVLCLPISQVRESLEFIMQDLQENTVILDTAPIKAEIFNWAKELLPVGCYYVGLAPALNPEVLHNLNQGVEAAREDLFVKGLFFVDAPPGVPEEVVTLASDFVRILGATPLLADLAESDGLMAVVHLLPQLAAAALLNATVDQPGWQEARKLASRPFAAVTSGLAYQDEIESLKISALQARANIVHSLDVLMAAIKGLRDDIEKADEDSLAERLEAALEGRQRWLNERLSADWSKPTSQPVDVPSFAERLFGSAFSKSRRPRK